MSLQHFFLDNQVLSETIKACENHAFCLDLLHEDLHHAKVLRLKPGEHIGVIDADGVFYECEITDFGNKMMVKNSQKQHSRKLHKCPQITLCAGLTKQNKFDDVIRACTEIGVLGFVPVEFKRSVVKLDKKKQKSKYERWCKIAKSAAMQSGQMQIPNVDPSFSFDYFCDFLDRFDSVLCFWEEAEKDLDTNSLMKICGDFDANSKLAIIIGPEGGIDSLEIEKIVAANSNTHVFGIGESILRAETACIFAASILKFCLSC